MSEIRQLDNNEVNIYPVTVEEAVYDKNGQRLDNKLKNIITSTEEESYEPTVPRDADTLGGIDASEYALKSDSNPIDIPLTLNPSVTSVSLSCKRTDNVVCICAEFTVDSQIAIDSVLMSGLPMPSSDIRYQAIITKYGTSSIYFARLYQGQLYTNVDIPKGTGYFISMTYIV